MGAAFTKDQGVCEGAEPGGDVDGATTGKVKTRKVEEPAIWVPGPIGDRAVDEGTPPEAEDDGGHDTATFKATADHDHGCAGRCELNVSVCGRTLELLGAKMVWGRLTKHQLVEAEH